MKILINIILINFFIFFTGCDSSSGSVTTSSVSSKTVARVNGTVVDGYIHGATVCLDSNLNGNCDVNEQTTLSDENGVFSFNNLSLEIDSLVSLLAVGGVDTSTTLNFQGQLRSVLYMTTVDNTQNIIISPITDLVATSFFNTVDKDLLSLNDAKGIVSDVLQITQQEIYKDPMKDIRLFITSQNIQQTKHLIQTATNKSVGSTLQLNEEVMLEDDIKEELINLNLEIDKVLVAMEIKLNSTINENEKIFIIKQLAELKDTLNTLSQDTSLDIDNLNRLQESVHKSLLESNELLLNADSNTTLEIVELNITTESITQSMFNTTYAILDEQACLAENGFNMLDNNAFKSERSNDLDNSISIKSDFAAGSNIEESEVKIFYPKLENSSKDDRVIVFQDGYYFVFDKAWIDNTNKTVYTMTPKEENGSYSCYRFELNFTTANNISGTKVFRYTDI